MVNSASKRLRSRGQALLLGWTCLDAHGTTATVVSEEVVPAFEDGMSLSEVLAPSSSWPNETLGTLNITS